MFNRKDNLREHLRAHAGQTKRKKRYKCEECNQEFLGLAVLNNHKREHNPHMLDGECGKQIDSYSSQADQVSHANKKTRHRLSTGREFQPD